ncbi:MAG: hypothetical protein DWQ07_06810 [Chloroflexi bacterium]|nr:MAG: hypothetical protein DWQ07_06810 [Chloroflexota bacterium]MBL1195589.1 hypothetical protein [Chloroflexota bacterium]
MIALLVLGLVACGRNSVAPNSPIDQAPSSIELTATASPESLFEGSWFRDGVFMDVFLPPEGGFIFRYAEDSSDNCGGSAYRASGTVELADTNTINLTGTGLCDGSSDEMDFSLQLIYDPVENVLRDSSGNVMTRS